MTKKITAIIPTLLKDKNILNKLIDNLANDNSVEEIIVINNSQEEISFDNLKTRVIFKGENLFVNPSWNLGVKEAKSEYITLVNDDIIIPLNFCSSVLEKMDENSGIIGIDNDYVINLRDENNNIKDIPQEAPVLSDNIKLTPVNFRPFSFGIMMFFNKKVYAPIPEDLKIFFGDDYIMHFAKREKKQNYIISGQNIVHCGSLSSNSFTDLAKKENNLYKKIVFPWYKRIFYFYKRDKHYCIYFLFLNFSIRKS